MISLSVTPWLANYVGLETEASSVRSFERELIPRLLQTAQYTREIHVLRGQLASDGLERRVKARLRRQERLTASNPLQLSALISEAALTRCARQSSVAAEQFRQLLSWAQRSLLEGPATGRRVAGVLRWVASSSTPRRMWRR